MAKPLRSQNGSVLPLVLIFSSIAFITVVAFVSGQYLIGRPSLMAPAMLQAQLNARSGVWKALDMLNHPPDTLKAINTLDSTFTNGLLGKPKDSVRNPSGRTYPRRQRAAYAATFFLRFLRLMRGDTVIFRLL
jgi:hypothetical protein